MGILTVLSLFSGGGGLDQGARIAGGFRTVAYVEVEPYAQAALMSEMRRGALDTAPLWDDVRTFDGRPWRGLVDVIAGGFPCQDVSVAGKRVGLAGTRSGLWRQFARIIREVGPRYVLVENVPGLLDQGLGSVLGDLATAGFDAAWECVSVAQVGGSSSRDRLWLVAVSDSIGQQAGILGQRLLVSLGKASDHHAQQLRRGLGDAGGLHGFHVWPARADQEQAAWEPRRRIESGLGRNAHGLADRRQRLGLLGNGVVPQQSVPAWERIKMMADGPASRGSGGGK